MASWQAWSSRLSTALVLGAISAQAAYADAVVSLAATPSPVVVGTPVSLNVSIAGAVDVYGYQFTLNFNPAVVRVTGVTEGTFLSGAGTTFFDAGNSNNTTGTVSFVFNSLLGSIAGANGAGSLARITFNTIAAGTSAFTLTNALLLDSTLNTLPSTFQGTSLVVSAVPEPATMLLFGLGLAGVAGVAVRRRQAA